MYSPQKIDDALSRLIKRASLYPDPTLADAVDAVRLIVRDQQLCIEQLKQLVEANKSKEDQNTLNR